MDSARILLIGDEPNILRTLRRNLVARGYDISIALDGQDAFELISCTDFDLYILHLDFETVQVNGLDICRQIRKLSQAPIIVLSGIGSETMKIGALDLGADDYLVLPFAMGEFLARARSALRRWSAYKTGVISQNSITLVGDLLVDAESRQVSISGKRIHLTPTEYELLQYLVKNRGKVITHRELLQAVWGPEYGDEREYLRVFIYQLRRKIEEDPMRPAYILTEPGVGYRFVTER